ncbi:hypothetical protein BJX62DRAFT_228507 [Aspergillus germanicus]
MESNILKAFSGSEEANNKIPLVPISDGQRSAQEPDPGQGNTATVREDAKHQLPAQNFDWAGSWTWEIASAAFSIICLVLLVIFLHYVDGAEYQTWQYRLSPNAVASAIVTAAKAALLLLVSSSLSQLKWTHATKKTPLYHIQVLDQASRGLWGSLEVLWRWNLKPGLITAGAFLTVFSIAIDPLAQQLLTYPSIRIKVPYSNGLTYAQSAKAYSAQENTGLDTLALAQYQLDPNMLGSILTGVDDQSTGLEPVCPTSDCEYPDFVSLAICSSCEDVTAKSTQTCNMTTAVLDHDPTSPYYMPDFFNQTLPLACSYTTPSNHTVSPQIVSGYMLDSSVEVQVYRQPWTSVITFSNHSTARILSFLAARYKHPKLIYTHQNATTWEQKPDLTECSFSWCEKKYGNNHYNSDSHRTLQAIHSQVLPDPTAGDEVFIFSSAFDHNESTLSVRYNSAIVINGALESIFNSTLIQDAFPPINIPILLYNSKNLTDTAAQLATTMTDAIRSAASGSGENPNVNGDAYKSTTIIHVRWGWVAVPVVSVAMGILILLATAFVSRKSILWKASVLPLLLGGVRTRREHDLTALPAHVDQIMAVAKSIEVVTETNYPLLLVEDYIL